MAKYLKSTSKIKDSDEVLEMYCEMCFKGGTTVAANGYCDTCMEYFCQTCARNHKRYLPTHLLHAMPAEICLEKCTIHRTELIKFFCESCGAIGCCVCRTENHKCENLDSVKAITLCAKNFEKRGELKILTGKIEKINSKLTTTKQSLEKDERLAVAAREAVKRTKQAICLKFDELENQMLSDIDRRNKNGSDSLQLVSNLVASLGKISSTIDQFLLIGSQTCKKFIALKRVENDVKAIETDLEKLQEYKGSVNYRFEENPKLKLFKEAIAKLPGLGSLVDDKTSTGTQVTKSQVITHKKVSFYSNFSVKGEDEKAECEIFSMCVLPGNFLVLSDTANSSIKLVNVSTQTVLSRRRVANVPFAVTAVKRDTIAINQDDLQDSEKGKIQFLIKTSNKELVFKRHSFTTEMPCDDILHYENSLYVVMSTVKQQKVQRLDMKGRVLESYIINSTGLNYLAFDAFSGTIYITAPYQDHLIAIKHGQVELKNEYKLCKGITTDSKGFVYICDTGSNSVGLINPEETLKTQYLLTEEEGLWRPACIEYCKKTDKLYIAMETGSNIKVFDVSEKKYKKELKLEWTETLVEQ